MEYEINVSQTRPNPVNPAFPNHFHTCRVTVPYENIQSVYDTLRTAYPESEGYNLSITRWEKHGHDITERYSHAPNP